MSDDGAMGIAQRILKIISGSGTVPENEAFKAAIIALGFAGQGGLDTAIGRILELEERNLLLYGIGSTAADRAADAKMRAFENTAYLPIHFDPTAADDLGDGSIGRPYKNLIAARLVPGRRHLIKAGTTIVTGAGDALNGWLAIPATGTAQAPIIIGRYGPDSLPNPIIDGTAAARVIRGLNNAKYWRIRDIEIIGGQTGGTTGRFGISQTSNDPVADQDVTFGIVISGVKVRGVTTDNANDCDGIKLHGADNLIINCEVYDIATDGIWFHGFRTKIIGTKVYRVAQDNRNAGDCIQSGAKSDGSRIRGNHLDHFEVEIKQCIYFEQTISVSNDVIIEDNYCVMADGNTKSAGPIVCGATNSIIRRNYCKGGVTGIVVGDGGKAYYNVVIQTVGRGIDLGLDCDAFNNTLIQVGNDTTQQFSVGIRCNSFGTRQARIFNNLMIGQYNGILGIAGAFVESNNAFAIRGVSDAKVRIAGTPVPPTNAVSATYPGSTLVDSNYRPLVGSPLLNAGNDNGLLDKFTKDYLPVTTYSIGAY